MAWTLSCRYKRLRQLAYVAVAIALGSLATSVYQQCWHTEGGVRRLRRDGGVVEWKLYDIGEAVEYGELPAEDVQRPKGARTSDALRLEDTTKNHSKVSHTFLQQLLSHPLSCSPGEGGLLQSKYGTLLQVLESYAVFHRRARTAKGVRTLVWLCDVHHYCGGLADRLKGIAYTLLLAMFSKRVLLISWGSSVSGEKEHMQPNAIDWVLREELYEDLFIEEVFWYGDIFSPDMILDDVVEHPNPSSLYFIHLGSVLKGIGVDVKYEQLKLSLHLIGSNSPQNVALGTNMEPSSLLNRTKTANQSWIATGVKAAGLAGLPPKDVDGIIGIVFRYLFQFSEDLMAEVAVAQQVLGLEGLKYTGVHMRTGFAGTPLQETVDHPKLIRKPEQWQRMLQCAVVSADEHLGKDSAIFLAADSPLVKHLALSTYGSRFRALDNAIVHLDKMAKFPHELFANETEATLSVFVELVILAQSHVQVCSPGSGYAMVATQLCSLPPNRVVDGRQCT